MDEDPKNRTKNIMGNKWKIFPILAPRTWIILGAKFRQWDNFPWFSPKKDLLF